MKKKINHLIFFVLLTYLSACVGYEPIFITSNLNLKIVSHSIEGDKKIGNKIYSNLNNSLKSDKSAKNVDVKINSKKKRSVVSKNSAGKNVEYKITLNTNLVITDTTSSSIILNRSFNYSLNYKAQDRYSDTLILENKSIDNLLNKISQDLIIALSQNIK